VDKVSKKFISVCTFFALLSSGWFPVRAAERTVLRENAITHGDSIHISDLLPLGVSEEIRARAGGVALGNSPLPGAHRIFARFQIENALRNSPELRFALIVPEEVDVTRWSRPLSREQIRTVLQGTERASANGLLKDMNLDQIEMPAAVLLTEDAARVAILQIEQPTASSEMHARMWIASEPKIPAFWITVHRKGEYSSGSDSSVMPSAIENAGSKTVQAPAPNLAPPVSLKSGEAVELVALSAGMRITSPAITVGSGGVGQQIRVRIPATGKIVMTTVVGPRTVQLKY
jgi:hypothetical protein